MVLNMISNQRYSHCLKCNGFLGDKESVAKVVGVCYNCHRNQYKKAVVLDDTPIYHFSDDDSSR